VPIQIPLEHPCRGGLIDHFFSALVLASLAAFFLLTIHLAYPIVLFSLSALCFVLYVPKWRQWVSKLKKEWITQPLFQNSVLLNVLFAAALGIALAAAVLPPLGYDAHEYHLAVPEQYLLHGGWVSFPHNVYAAFPMNVELLYLWPLAVESAAGCTVINFLFALLTALAVVRLAAVGGFAEKSLLPALIFLSTGLVLRLIIQANVDLGLSCSAAILLLGYERFRLHPSRGMGCIMAVALGFALGSKYIALISLLAPFCALVCADIILTRRYNLIKPIVLILLAGVVLWIPWLVRNAVYYHNPVYPLLTSIFGGIPPFFADLFHAAHSPPNESFTAKLSEFFTLPFRKSFVGEFPLGFTCLWLFGIPAVLAGRRDRLSIRMGIFMVAAYVIWFWGTQRNDRFLATLLPGMAIFPCLGVIALGKEKIRQFTSGAILLIVSFQLWAMTSTLLREGATDYLFAPTFEQEYFKRHLPHYRAIAWLNRLQDEEERFHVGDVLFIGEAQTYGSRFRVIAPTVFNHHPLQIGLNPSVTHIFYNGVELNRLRSGYSPLGWPLGDFLDGWIRQSRGTRLRKVYDAHPQQPDRWVVYEVIR